MARSRIFDTIWREYFDPKIVQVPVDLYKAYLPRVDVVPWPVYDDNVLEIDLRFQRIIGDAFGRIAAIVARVPPQSVSISMRQLIDQIPSIMSGSQDALRVVAHGRVVKTVRVNSALLEHCTAIQRALLERLLLFEDMQAVLPVEEVDGWADMAFPGGEDLRHVYKGGAKASAVLHLLRIAMRDGQRTVVFVRNIPVCEALSRLLTAEHIPAQFIHGDLDEQVRENRIYAFKRGDIPILLATRQLFGRGFDIPEADQAIFYSPKESERVMWQEMLRIRGTIRKPKKVYVLFYAWTAEARKLVRLAQGMMRTNASWLGDRFRWTYNEVEETGGQQKIPAGTSKIATDAERSSVTGKFISEVLHRVSGLLRKRLPEIDGAFEEAAERIGLFRVWPRELVRVLLLELSATIERLATSQKTGGDAIKRELAKVLHPDKHPSAFGIEKQFWHELFVALEM